MIGGWPCSGEYSKSVCKAYTLCACTCTCNYTYMVAWSETFGCFKCTTVHLIGRVFAIPTYRVCWLYNRYTLDLTHSSTILVITRSSLASDDFSIKFVMMLMKAFLDSWGIIDIRVLHMSRPSWRRSEIRGAVWTSGAGVVERCSLWSFWTSLRNIGSVLK